MLKDPFYIATTNLIQVTVFPIYLDTQSCPDENHFLWAYHICIENKSEEPIQLRLRHWEITDGFGRKQIVEGTGVVGEEPIINPGEIYEYTSGTPLTTPSGVMVGQYEMEKPNGDRFFVQVPSFSLDSPYQPITLN